MTDPDAFNEHMKDVLAVDEELEEFLKSLPDTERRLEKMQKTAEARLVL